MEDVIIIGGSFAGLTAALQLGRASRRVTVVDAGGPRNRTSPGAHGVPGWDGTPPATILEKFRADALAYPTVRIVTDTVIGTAGVQDGFRVDLAGGEMLASRRILLSHGVRDTLPDLPGVSEVWGRSLLHCPYCHGFEVKDRPLAVLTNHAMSGHQAQLIRADWSADVTLLTGIDSAFDATGFAHAGFAIEPRRVAGFKEATDGITVEFDKGAASRFAAIFAAPRVSLDDSPAQMLGCAYEEGPLGPYVQVGPMGQTSAPGVFAAGDCARPGHNVTSAIGDGATAGIGCHQSLVFPEMIQPLEAAA